MKRTLFTILLTAIAVACLAQDKPTPMALLDKTHAILSQGGGVTGQFTATTFQGTSPQNTTSGTMSMMGQKYVLKTPDMSTWYNGKKQWTMIAGTDEVNVTVPTTAELSQSSPGAYLSLYKQGYKLSIKGTTLRNRKAWDVTMKARSKKQQPSQVVVTIDAQTNHPMCIRVKYRNDWSRISIQNLRTNNKLNARDFEFPASQYPGVEIININ